MEVKVTLVLSPEEVAFIKSTVRKVVIGHNHYMGDFEQSPAGHDAAARLYCRLFKPIRIPSKVKEKDHAAL